jgi:hypothetical protein
MNLTHYLVAIVLPIAALTGCQNVTHEDYEAATTPVVGNIGHGQHIVIDGVDIWTAGTPDRAYIILGTGVQDAGRKGVGALSYHPKPDYSRLAATAKTFHANAVLIAGEAVSTGITPGERPAEYTTRFHLIRYN